MDNDPYNGQNGYTNFNNYKPKTHKNNNSSATSQTQGNSTQQQNTYQSPTYAYQAPSQNTPYQQKSDNSNLFGIISIILDLPLFIICCGCGLLPLTGSIVGLLGVIKDKKSVASWFGLIIGIILTLCYMAYLVYVATHPDFLSSIIEQIENY